jgi:hypothetical protein
MQVTRAGHYSFGRFGFPIWRVTHDGVDVPTDGPLLGFWATPGEYRIERRLIWQEAAGGAGTALALGLLLVLCLPAGRKAVASAGRRPPSQG